MPARILKAAMAACILGMPCSTSAQTIVTLDVPLNLTQVSPDIEKVRIGCSLQGPGLELPTRPSGRGGVEQLPLAAQEEMTVLAGQLVITMRLMFPISAEFIPADPLGKQVGYACALLGFSKSLQQWDFFSEAATVAAFRLKPTPQSISGSFVW